MKYWFYILFTLISLTISAQDTLEICAGESKTLSFYSTATGDGVNIWNIFGTEYISDELTYTFNQPGTFIINLKRENGPCYVEQSYQITIIGCPSLLYWVPNTFTPDGNEYNQVFKPIITEGIDVIGYNFIIFNRWGEVIWETNDPNSGWAGMYNNNMSQDGIYTWKLNLNVFGNDGKIVDYGFVTLLR